ncbi:hypothetical protein ACF073_08265 [Streptomyces sp. NPDC015171]|uniref:hypothetical protein n=1 Tax=Streptomyces sp. NPDC015171 TaxID=3364945 RepID=UPI0036FF8D67
MGASMAVRGVRAAVFAAVCVLLAAAGHGLAVGDTPSLWADAAGFLAVFTLGWACGGRERSLPGIGAAMLLTQAGLHLGFDAAHDGGTGATRRDPWPGRPGSPGGVPDMVAAGHSHVRHFAAPAHSHLGAHPYLGVHPHLTAHATAAHLLAALVASWWLRRGEAALWSLLRRAVTLVPALAAWWRYAPLPVSDSPVPLVPTDPGPPRPAPLRHAVRRRGPPAPIPYST